MSCLARYAEHYGTPDPDMSWWLFVGLFGHIAKIELRALLTAIEGPSVALNRLGGAEGNTRLQWLLGDIEEALK